jgi:hypothetical protein
MSRADQLRDKAVEILSHEKEGIRYANLMRAIEKAFPEVNHNTITGSLYNLDATRPKAVYKPDRGLFRHTQFKEDGLEQDIEIAELPEHRTVSEGAFYDSFADWIKNELEECTKAIPLGGNKFKDKWGTPDVIGLRSPKPSDIVKMPMEIVSAEIKLDSNALITAFGQACSYKLFSHKVYLVIPKQSSESDSTRLDALCRIFGIGLILFDAGNPDLPNYEIRVRATKNEPDMFYVNKNIKTVENELF